MSKQFLEAAIQTAMEAGGFLLAEFGRPAEAARKGELDLVTRADRKSEQLIVSRWQRCFPKQLSYWRKEEVRISACAIAGLWILWTAQRNETVFHSLQEAHQRTGIAPIRFRPWL